MKTHMKLEIRMFTLHVLSKFCKYSINSNNTDNDYLPLLLKGHKNQTLQWSKLSRIFHI